MDDGSRDATPDILAAWALRDRRVSILTQPPKGMVAALELARSRARGRFLARMDADDVCESDRFAAQRAFLEADDGLAGCGAGVRYFPRARLKGGARRYEAWINGATTPEQVHNAVFVECPLAHPAFFLDAEAVAAVGGYRDMGWPEDYDLVLRLWASGRRLANVPRVLLHWREGPGRLSRNHGAYAPDAFVACKVHHLRRTLLSGGRPAVIWGSGPVGKTFAKALLAAGTEVAAFVDVDPRKIGQEIHGAPVLDMTGGKAIPGVLHLAAVGQPGARDTVRRALREAGLEEARDFVAVA